jgi:hypothetical protein
MTATEACFTGPNTPALVTDIVKAAQAIRDPVMDGPDKGRWRRAARLATGEGQGE